MAPSIDTSSSQGFSTLIIAINAFGVRSFERIESVMSVVKIGALVGFIIYGGVMLSAAFGHKSMGLGSEITFYHAGVEGDSCQMDGAAFCKAC